MSGDTFASDRASSLGGGIFVNSSFGLKVVNSTFATSVHGGIVSIGGGGEVTFSTFSATELGGLEIHLSNSILLSVECILNVSDENLNLQFGSTGCPNSIPTANPDVDPSRFLMNNGGLTPTIALLPSSPAIGAIPNADCTDQEGNRVTTDQRGFPRPGSGPGGPCTVGAFEFQGPVP